MARAVASILGVLAVAGCGGEPTLTAVPQATFHFDSGGAWHLQGYGAWQVEVTRAGRFTVQHTVRDVVKDYGSLDLAPGQARTLWAAIDAADLPAVRVTKRSGVPDEAQLVFALSEGEALRTALSIWQNDVAEHALLRTVLDRLRALIETHHGVKPVF